MADLAWNYDELGLGFDNEKVTLEGCIAVSFSVKKK